jgi:hypothetical protein
MSVTVQPERETLDQRTQRKVRTQELLADPAGIESMLAAIGSGMSLRDWCMINGVVYSTVQLRLVTDDTLRPMYEAARIRQAEAVLDEIKELEERLEGVEGREPIDPKAAAVLIGSKQWRAERLNPKRYGQRSYQEVTTFDANKAHLEELKKLTERRRVTATLVGSERAQLVQLPAGAVLDRDPTVIDAEVVEVKRE